MRSISGIRRRCSNSRDVLHEFDSSLNTKIHSSSHENIVENMMAMITDFQEAKYSIR